MPYSPPAGSAVNFNFFGSAYTPPPGTGISFNFETVGGAIDRFLTATCNVDVSYASTLARIMFVRVYGALWPVVLRGFFKTMSASRSATMSWTRITIKYRTITTVVVTTAATMHRDFAVFLTRLVHAVPTRSRVISLTRSLVVSVAGTRVNSFPRTLVAAAGAVASRARQINRRLTAAASSAALFLKIRPLVLWFTVHPAPTLLRHRWMTLSATAAHLVSRVRQVRLTRSTNSSLTVQFRRKVNKTLSVAAAALASRTRRVGRNLVLAARATPHAVRRMSLIMSVTVVKAAFNVHPATRLVVLSATRAAGATFRRAYGKILRVAVQRLPGLTRVLGAFRRALDQREWRVQAVATEWLLDARTTLWEAEARSATWTPEPTEDLLWRAARRPPP